MGTKNVLKAATWPLAPSNVLLKKISEGGERVRGPLFSVDSPPPCTIQVQQIVTNLISTCGGRRHLPLRMSQR